MNTSLKISAAPKPSLKAKLFIRLKMVDVLSLSEREIAGMIQAIEQDPLFQKLMGLEGAEYRVLKRQRYPRTALSNRFQELKEGFAADPSTPDVQEFLADREDVVSLIRSIGQENFERYFIHQETLLTRREIAERCGLSEEKARKVFDFLLRFSAQTEFFHPSSFPPAPEARPLCLGRVEGDMSAGFVLSFFSPHLARGRYRIDYDTWERLSSRKILSAEERRRAAVLLRQVEMLNMRSDNFHRVLQEVLEVERAYLGSGKGERKRTLSLRETSRRLGVSSSTVCRLVVGRSVVLPWGEEVLLSRLFPQKKEVLREILEGNAESLSEAGDGDVQRFLWDQYQLRVPRRTVNYWRHRLETP